MRAVFIGTGEIGRPTLRTLLDSDQHRIVGVVTQPDKPAGRSQRIEASAIKKEIAGREIPLLQPARIKDQSAIAELRALSPDVIVVMAYGQILPRDVLEIPTTACLNLHASLLPRWRGAAPIQAAIAAGDTETGITVMYMDEGLDTGDILLQRKIEITPSDTGQSLHDRLGQIAPEASMEALRLLSTGEAPRTRQDDGLANYAPKLNRDAGKLDWAEAAEVLERKIRAFDPWPGAFMTIEESPGRSSRLKIFRAAVIGKVGRPGEIIPDPQGLIVGTGRGALSLEEVQLEGKRRMSARDFVRGRRS